jgi:GPI ethanolamine phosphate transferase 1
LENINFIDDEVRKLVQSVESTFENDGRTAYVFTADHGMTDWGKAFS